MENTKEIKIRGAPLNFWTPNPDRSLAVLALFHELGSPETVGCWPAIWHQTCRGSEPKSRSNRKVVVSPRGERPRPGTVLVLYYLSTRQTSRVFFNTNQPTRYPTRRAFMTRSPMVSRDFTRELTPLQPVTGEIGFCCFVTPRICPFERWLSSTNREI